MAGEDPQEMVADLFERYHVAIFASLYRLLGDRVSTVFLLATVALWVAACTTPPQPAGPVAVATALPTPAAVADAALTNLRPLTASGGARFGVWTPDGRALVFAESDRPLLPILLPGNLPKIVTKEASLDGSAVRTQGEGFPLFFSQDGRTLYLNRELAGDGMGGLWAMDMATGTMRRAVEGMGGMVAHQLSDGRIVIAENGTYAPLRVYDPATGALADLTGPFPSNSPDSARVSPDGTRLAYAQFQDVYLANADGSNAQPISQGGGFSANVWWSPDSQILAYTTGANWMDRLLLADRDGRTLATLVPSQRDFGWVSQVEWSPDSQRMLVLSQAYSDQLPRPDRLFLMDTAGHSQLLLEEYLHDVAWSPDGRTMALSRWDGPQGELATDDVWLAELTDRATLASLPTSTPMPVPSPTPPLPLPPTTMSPEDVIRRFWRAIDAEDYVTAYATRTSANRARTGLAYFRSDWDCVDRARVLEIAPMGEAAGIERMFTVQVELQVKPNCDGWMQPGPFASLVRETTDGPWLIHAFNTGP